MIKNKLYLIALLLITVVAFFSLYQNQKQVEQSKEANKVLQAPKDSLSYRGEEGKDALSLLKAKTEVLQNNSGLVVSIAGRKANEFKREYWSFYVNGKVAEVGPATYKTKNADIIEWKIETY